MTEVLSAETIAEITEKRSFLMGLYALTDDQRAATGPGPVIAEPHASGEIGAEHVQAAERWRADWLVYIEPVETADELAAYEAAWNRLRKVRDRIGMVAEMRLGMLIGAHQTCEQAGSRIFPKTTLAAATALVRGSFVEIIEQMTLSMRPRELLAA